MYKNKKIITVIPARGGSKGIPRKNLRLLDNRPLIYYTIDSAKKSKWIDKIVVSTDDDEIESVGRLYGVEVERRGIGLSGDAVPLDPVIFDVRKKQEEKGINFDYYITLQPTVPLLSSDTLDESIKYIVEGKFDSIIGVVDETHLYWIDEGNEIKPLYKERLNRQYLDKIYKECGYFISKKEVIKQNSRLGENISVFTIPKAESYDIDTYEDIWIVEGILQRKNIAIRVIGNNLVGLGHIYRMLTLVSKLYKHNICFYIDPTDDLAILKVKENNYPHKIFHTEQGFLDLITKDKIDILINDTLDTSKSYIERIKSRNVFLVTFEDMGSGIEDANIVFNALYETQLKNPNHYFGSNYVILRQDMYYQSFIEFHENTSTVLLTFGGIDENNLTERTLKVLTEIYNGKIIIIVGLGYENFDTLQTLIKKYPNKIDLYKNVKNMAQLLSQADVAVTSKGRTLYELSSLGVPSVAIAQNDREMKHLFAEKTNGIISLGKSSMITNEEIKTQLNKIIHNNAFRKKCYQNLKEHNLKSGLDNVIDIIYQEYRRHNYA